MKILTIIGARPQFIKAAVVSRAIAKRTGIREIIVHTGQHFDANMSDIFFEEMEIPKPHYNLGVSGLNHGAMTGAMLAALEPVMMDEKPDMVMVYGDTNSTLAGALAAVKLHIPVAHVEAGLRSFNMRMPEEVNRILTDRVSSLLFCPTENAVRNLRAEGFNGFPCRIVQCGDVMYDAALYYAEKAANTSSVIANLGLTPGAYVLSTIHRAENTDDPERLAEIVKGLAKINAEMEVIVPLHPRTRKSIERTGVNISVRCIEPVGYFDMIELIRNSALVMTDSGGLQKEAYFFKKHCVTLREETEWLELLDAGYNLVTGDGALGIYEAFKSMITKNSKFGEALYGNGAAADIIIDTIGSSTREEMMSVI